MTTGPGPYGFGQQAVHTRTLRAGKERTIHTARSGGATGQVTQARGRSDAVSTAFIGGQEGLLVTTNPTDSDECSYDGEPTTCRLIATGPLTYARP